MNGKQVIIGQKRWFSLHFAKYNVKSVPGIITVNGKEYKRDNYTNVTKHILSHVGKNNHNLEYHPLCLIKQRITNYFHSKFVGRTGNSVFSIYDNISPVVTVNENFDSLLVPPNHVSRNKTDCYYINAEYMLRSHTTAHQAELILMGLDNFVVFGDVYRNDEIDCTHYPVFHQADGVYSLDIDQIRQLSGSNIDIFEKNITEDTEVKQKEHTLDAVKVMENHLKNTLCSLVQHLFGKDTSWRWVETTFPFTHPSWELEIELNGEWTEVLGCGIMKQGIIKTAGAGTRIGWAFGLGLERLAMKIYSIPDIRVFWSNDTGFLCQFKGATADQAITFKPVSVHPQNICDISFWLPNDNTYSKNDFLEIVKKLGENIVEQVYLIDEFENPKTGCKSHCFRIIYRHMERPLTKEEVSVIHKKIGDYASRLLKLKIR